MSTGRAYMNSAMRPHIGFGLYRKLPGPFRLFLISIFVFSASVVASFAQSAWKDHLPIASSTPTTFHSASQSPTPSTDTNSGLAATDESDAANQAAQQPAKQAAPVAAPAPTCDTESIPYQTTYVNDPKLPQGEQNVAAYGVNGSTVSCPGQAPQTTPPQDEVIHMGTYTAPTDTQPTPDPTDSQTQCDAAAGTPCPHGRMDKAN